MRTNPFVFSYLPGKVNCGRLPSVCIGQLDLFCQTNLPVKEIMKTNIALLLIDMQKDFLLPEKHGNCEQKL